ncbi:site-specific tyrosine recombinase [Bacteriophage DSS3_MAL1]|nr:site-specific tyrosine recombinase [Bacteriophage DSS3_MAL1]
MASITKKADGKYRLRYKDVDGKTVNKTFARKRDAEAFKAEATLLENHIRGGELEYSPMLYRELVDAWLTAAENGDRDNKAPLSPQTLRGYIGYCRNHLVPLLGDLPLKEITSAKAREVRTELLSRFQQRSSANQAFNVFKGSLSYAVEMEFMPKNPAAAITIKMSKDRVDTTGDNPDIEETVVIPDRTDIGKLCHAAVMLRDTHNHKQVRDAWIKYAAMFFTLLMTGARSGEMRALRWRDFDFDASRVHIRRNADAHTSEIIPPKWHSVRSVPLHPELAEHLLLFHKPDDSPDKAVFAGVESGKIPAHSHVYNRMWSRLLRAADVRHYKLHHLRHYYASRLIADGVDIKKVSKWMGHHSVAFTLDQYGHLLPEDTDEAFASVRFN